jgi:DMSO/TMAO reductase YedYZ molybdopterin-dependent catalytic subunit
MKRMDRRTALRALGSAGALLLAGCDRLSDSTWFPKVLEVGERLSRGVHHAVTSRRSLAQEFSEADLSPEFRSNGTSLPDNAQYKAMARAGFVDWRLSVDGLVHNPQTFSLDRLRSMQSRTQITRHDCVEGWSAIGKWTGVPLSEVLAIVQPRERARFVVFHCADPKGDDGSDFYYESIDMEDAYHPQTILAYGLNGQALPIKNGAPLRLRVERQLGYKHAKYLMRLELVESFGHIAGGSGGYWEDNGYQWYAGI